MNQSSLLVTEKTELAPTPSPGSLMRLALLAFCAIFRRDVKVMSHQFLRFAVQVLLQPLFFLFIFGKVLPTIGFASQNLAPLLLPGVVALTLVTTAFQGVTLPLVLDLGFAHEIEDRLLAPIPISLVAIEKILFAALQGLIAGAIIFPLAFLILGNLYLVRTDTILLLIGLMVLTALAGASLGLTLGTLVKPEQLGLLFSLIFTPLIFTGCTFYPWGSLQSLRWFQIVTLFNPLTYASEGLRQSMVPPLQGYTVSTIGLLWSLTGLGVTFILFLIVGLTSFHRRVVA